MTENVTTMQNLESYNDMMTANAQLMSEVYTDPKLTAAIADFKKTGTY